MAGPNDVFRFPRTDFEVRNRAIVAAMTNKQSHEDGSLSDAEIEWLRRRAEGGFGIVTTAASHVVREGQGWDGEMGVWGGHQLPGLQRMAAGIQAHGALALAQIFHGGMRCPQSLTGVQPVSASVNETSDSDSGNTRELEDAEVSALVEAFADAAARRLASMGLRFTVPTVTSSANSSAPERTGGLIVGAVRCQIARAF